MKKTKDQIVTEMYQAGLLNEDDTARYLIDESVNASDMKYIKQMIQLCEKSQKEIDSGQEYSINEVFDRIKRKYNGNKVLSNS